MSGGVHNMNAPISIDQLKSIIAEAKECGWRECHQSVQAVTHTRAKYNPVDLVIGIRDDIDSLANPYEGPAPGEGGLSSIGEAA